MLKLIFRKLTEYIHTGPLDEWRPYVRGGDLVMRRKVAGKWEFRHASVDESHEFNAAEMW